MMFMSPRLLGFVFALLAVALPLRAGTIPRVSTIYNMTVKGDCYSITPNGTGGVTTKYLRSFQQNGQMKVTPVVVTAGTTNGSNVRDVAILVDHGTVQGGGVGALQYVTNGALYNFIAPGSYPAFDYATVVKNATATALTITHDKTLVNANNSFKIDDSLLALPYTVKTAKITITFLANGRVSGKITTTGQGLLGSGLGSIVATFSGVATT
jgi:hypothetical protein